MVELMALSSGEAPLTKESEGRCRLRLVGSGEEIDVPFLMLSEHVNGWTNLCPEQDATFKKKRQKKIK